MASPSLNHAVTKDGGYYNKLQRPDDYLETTTSSLLRPSSAVMPHTPYSHKRKRRQDAAPGKKRVRAEDSMGRANIGPVDKEYGMRTMLPGGNEDEQLSDDSANVALAYVRSVRSEASMIPSLLVAPSSDNGIEGDDAYSPGIDVSDKSRSLYHDGTWFSLDKEPEATHEEHDWDGDDDKSDAQEAYSKLLLKRFQTLRGRILDAKTSSSGRDVATTSQDSCSIQLPDSKRAWLQTIDRDWPSISQLLRLDERALYLGLQSCAFSLSQSTTLPRKRCCWIWSLMASIGDAGTLDHERISKIRDLAVQAGRLGNRIRENGGGQSKLNKNVGADDRGFRENNSGHNMEEGATEDHGTMKLYMAEKPTLGEELKDGDEIERPLPGGEKVERRHGGSSNRTTSESEAEMSMSEIEDQGQKKADVKALEQARARLLAQLGDRLVQARVPSSRAEAEGQRRQMHNSKPPNGIIQNDHDHIGTSSHQGHTASPALTQADWNTKAAIDIILTVAAECYGQKDLLSYKETW